MKFKKKSTIRITEKTYELLSSMKEDESFNSLIKRLIEDHMFLGLEKQLADIKKIMLIQVLLANPVYESQGAELLKGLVSEMISNPA